jgi:hypothetical protein
MRGAAAGAAVTMLLAAGCASGGDGDTGSADVASSVAAPSVTAAPATDAPTTTTTAAPLSLYDAACAGSLTVATVGRVAAAAGSELSGIVASRTHPGVLWVHNDSGAGPEVYAIGLDGALLATYELAAEAKDWEDIAVGPSTTAADGWALYLGDIGDNAEARSKVELYRIDEPAVTAGAPAAAGPETAQPISSVRTITLTYPDHPHNAEAMLVDPITGDLVIITKETSGVAQVFVVAAAALGSGAATPVLAGTLDMGAGLGGLVTGADISPDGSLVAVRTYATVRLYARAPGQSVAEALVPPPCDGPMPIEVQGEAVTITADGRSYVTVSEGAEQLLHQTAP